jgi:hypothetical protein
MSFFLLLGTIGMYYWMSNKVSLPLPDAICALYRERVLYRTHLLLPDVICVVRMFVCIYACMHACMHALSLSLSLSLFHYMHASLPLSLPR